MEFMIFVFLYPFYGIPTFLGGLFVWSLLRHRIDVKDSDYLFLILPWVTWNIFLTINDSGKSMANVLEAPILGCIVTVIFATRLLLEINNPKYKPSWDVYAHVAAGVAAVLIWALMPSLPE